ncbi:MAG: TonB-dependent receptor plug domain-containing protein [Opitutales bacterium]
MRSLVGLAAIAGLLCAPLANAETEAGLDEDFTELSLEELLDVQIYTASKREEPLFTTPSASYVLSGDDIRSTGVTHLADALRVVPGVNVASFNSNRWAVSVRGFNSVFNNNLLTLIDGRVLFSNSFAGTFWAEVDILLDNIQSIEVVRGPGGSVWGANAVNGVINVISKPASETQGTLVKGRIGTQERTAAFRYGGKLDNHEAYYRIWAKYSDYDAFENPLGPDFDSWDSYQAAARLDWELQNDRSLIFEVGGYRQDIDDLFAMLSADAIHTVESLYVTGAWIHRNGPDRQREIRSYLNYTDFNALLDLRQSEYRFDLQYQESLPLGSRSQLTFGAGYRLDWDDTRGNLFTFLEPTEDSRHTFNAFFQNKFAVLPDKLFVLGGLKFEYHSFIGPVYQPDAKILFTPTKDQTYWGSVAHAVRTPTRSERALRGFAPGSFPPTPLMGNENLAEESVTAYELGARWRVRQRVSIDVAAFYNTYQDLAGPANLMGVRTFEDVGDAETYGIEVAMDYNVSEDLQIRTSYSFLKLDFDGSAIARPSFEAQDTRTPEQQYSVLATWTPTEQLEFSGVLRYYDNLFDAQSMTSIDGYLQADLRAAWKPNERLEFSLVGRNLLDASQQEVFTVNSVTPTEVPREVYVQATLSF